MSGRKVKDVIRFPVSTRDLRLEMTRVMHEGLLVPVLMRGSETVVWREKEVPRIVIEQTNG